MVVAELMMTSSFKPGTCKVLQLAGSNQELSLPSPVQKTVPWSQDGRRLASASEDGVVKVWDPATGKELGQFQYAARPPVRPDRPDLFADKTSRGPNLAWGPAGERLAVADDNGSINIWDVQARQVRLTLPGRQGPLRLAWNPSGDRLAASCPDELPNPQGPTAFITIWDTNTGQEVISLPGASGTGPIAWSADGWRLTTSSISPRTGGAAVWDATPPARTTAR
jgi:WD40 repeat protein